MWPWILIPLLLIVLLILIFLISKSRYYRRMFSQGHFLEVHERFTAALRTALKCSGDTTPNPDDGTAFISSAGLLIAVSNHFEEGRHALHVSISQPGVVNTHAVANRFSFFFLAILGGNTMDLSPFYSQNHVQHLVLIRDNPELQINAFEESYADYRRNFRPIPFQPHHVDC